MISLLEPKVKQYFSLFAFLLALFSVVFGL